MWSSTTFRVGLGVQELDNALDLVRRRRPTAPLPETETGAVGEAFRSPDVWPEVARAADAEAVRRAMYARPDAQRKTIELADFEGLTQVEIAERTNAPLGTLKSRVRICLTQQRRLLEET